MGKKVIIWGTGYEADKLMKWLSVANRVAEKFLGEKACEVVGFLDSNVQKTQQLFYDRKVKLPKTIWYENANTVIVAVAKNEEIVSELEQHGYSRRESYLTLEDFYVWLWRDSGLTWRLVKAIVPDDDFVSGMREKIVPQDMPARFEDFYRKMRNACDERGCADQMKSLQDLMVLSVLLASCDWLDREAMGGKLIEMVGIARFVTLLESVYKDSTNLAARWMPHTSNKASHRALPRTIALYYTRYYNGGIERVISKLLRLFYVNDYQLVFFTDEIREDMEYPLPDGVKRVLLGQEGGRQGRCERLLQALQDFHVDIFFSHARTFNAFYDLLCVQQAGVSVVLELHNNFSFIENMPNKNILTMARRVEALVTLSRVDEMFWHLLGCRSIYVPNPVESPEEGEAEPVPYTILCLQRIDQAQKQVFELPAILEYVVQVLPNVRLQIVGRADNQKIEERLRKMFEERNLLGNVDFLGFHTEVAKYYRQASVMLMTSKFEGFPMTVAESKRYGTPLVMYELPYIELLRDGCGYIAVPQYDQRGAADALVRVLSDRVLRDRLSNEAKASLKAFSKINLMKAWEKVFALAMSNKSAPVFSEEEKTFSEIEHLLVQLAERIKREHVT